MTEWALNEAVLASIEYIDATRVLGTNQQIVEYERRAVVWKR